MNIEAALYDGIRYIGVLAPVPTAYVISISLNEHLKWNIIIAFISAVIIEVVGFGVVYMYAIFREYNQSKRRTDPAAPLAIVGGMVIAYLVSVLLLTVVLDIYPEFAIYAPGIFPFLSVIGMALTALRFDHRQRLDAIMQEKKERLETRKPKAQLPLTKTQQEATPLGTRAKIAQYWLDNPKGNHTAAGLVAGVSRQRAAQLHKAAPNGKHPAPHTEVTV